MSPMNLNMQRRMPFLNMRVNINNNINANNIQPPKQPSSPKMDKNARTDYYGEKIYEKISKAQKYAAYESIFPKIVGIFLDLNDGVIERLLTDDQYFDEQVEETIRLLGDKEKTN